MLLSVLLVGGVISLMWLEENIGYILCWCLVIAILSFMWLPEVKKLSTKWFGLTKKLSDVEVQYKEFKETIYPLLELSLSSIVSRHYFGGGPKSEEYDKLIQNSEKIIEHNNFDDLKPLLLASKAFLLRSIRDELSIIEHNELGTNDSKNYINDGFQEYIDSRYINPDEVYVNIDGLKEIQNSLPDNANKKKYTSRLKLLEKVYKENFE